MSAYFRFDARKATEILLYISSSCHSVYTALKVVYFADRDHLARYGRLICGDRYIAMKLGPVPSGAYDIVKAARNEGINYLRFEDLVEGSLKVVDEKTIIPLREANKELLSASDIECLDRAIDTYGHLTFQQLKAVSHRDPAWKKTNRDDVMALETIVKTLPGGDALLEYIQGQ